MACIRLLKRTRSTVGILAGLALATGIAGAQVLPSRISPVSVASQTAEPARSTAQTYQTTPAEMVSVPGPLRSLLRIAGISQNTAAADVLPLLSRAIYQDGYEGQNPTEFLTLIKRYLQQARELKALAQPSGTIRVERCEDANRLLQILGYKLEAGCTGAEIRLHTSEPTRAFLTVDSGFPLTDLEEAFQQGTPFTYAYPDSSVPVLYEKQAWLKLDQGPQFRSGDLVDALLDEPATARLYWAMSKMDQQTGRDLEHGLGLRALVPYRELLDFYGGQITIRTGRVTVPGGAPAEPAWKSLVGAGADAPGPFLSRLLSRDNGWLAAYYDALSRVNAGQQEHLTQVPRLAQYYAAFHA